MTAPSWLAFHQCYEHADRHTTISQRWAGTSSARARAARWGSRRLGQLYVRGQRRVSRPPVPFLPDACRHCAGIRQPGLPGDVQVQGRERRLKRTLLPVDRTSFWIVMTAAAQGKTFPRRRTPVLLCADAVGTNPDPPAREVSELGTRSGSALLKQDEARFGQHPLLPGGQAAAGHYKKHALICRGQGLSAARLRGDATRPAAGCQRRHRLAWLMRGAARVRMRSAARVRLRRWPALPSARTSAQRSRRFLRRRPRSWRSARARRRLAGRPWSS